MCVNYLAGKFSENDMMYQNQNSNQYSFSTLFSSLGTNESKFTRHDYIIINIMTQFNENGFFKIGQVYNYV